MDDVAIFNPLNTDFKVSYDLSGNNPQHFFLKAKEITYISQRYARFVKKHLADKMFDVKGDYHKNRQPQIDKFIKDMEV